MDKIKTFFSKTFLYIRHTKLGKLLASLLLALISFSLINVWDFMAIAGLVFTIYPLGLTLTMISYAWIINPIKNYKKLKSESQTELFTYEPDTISEPIIEKDALPFFPAQTYTTTDILIESSKKRAPKVIASSILKKASKIKTTTVTKKKVATKKKAVKKKITNKKNK